MADGMRSGLSSGAGAEMLVKDLNDHLILFFDGRNPDARRLTPEWNWQDDAAMNLGIATYAIHRGDEALVYDTFTSPDQARRVRAHLEGRGVRRFTVVNSHWHLDHVGGNAAYQDAAIVACALTRDHLAKQRAEIESGTLWGPPAIQPLALPTRTFEGRLDLDVGGIRVELHQVNIHSKDSTVLYLPADKALLAGDTLEDTLTYMVEIEGLADHVANLRKLREMDIEAIFPNHGDPAVIQGGGYGKTLIDATIGYITRMVRRAHDEGCLNGTMEEYVQASAAKGWIHPFAPYRDVHQQNLKLVHDHYKDRPLPEL
ncbi:MBL fold metallo-hydrolase [Sorangium cellulosum]|uniref:MBL fold metallo-hydrolase n=1 Tax=Sorangium cellulosum TaxID=56 RepID=A0A2L0EMJ9_SORCE|nr:MBL fold metallo-hydrolase [Sorangium cellulosum]AUX40527.1 MBL fold metallo-hydrolase [Sorangium cellulosum]